MKRITLMGVLCACLILFCCSCEREGGIVGTWEYRTPEWHGMTTCHRMTFDSDGSYEIVCAFEDMGEPQTAIERGHYTYIAERLTLSNRAIVYDEHGVGELPIGGEPIEYRVCVNGRKLYLYDDVNHEAVIYNKK